MSNEIYVNSFGLVLDIAGAVLIYFFGIPSKIDRDGHTFLIVETENKEEKTKAKKYDQLSMLGVCLLILGFISQLVSNFI